jgi:Flp pilus assembly protein TadG
MTMKRKISQAGQSLVEFALLLPVLVLFLMVIFDLGRAAYYYSAINNAAREGARYGAVRWYDPMVTTHIRESVERLTAALNADQISITSIYYDTDVDGKDDILRVTVSYQFQTATPIITRLLGQADNTLTLSSQATMRLER